MNAPPEPLRPGPLFSRPWFWIAATVLVGTLVRIPQLLQPATGPYAFRVTQTAFAVREFGRGGVDLLSSPLPVFGVVTSVPFELPLFQAFARELMRLGPDATEASRIAALVSFQAVAVLWGVVLTRWVGVRVAVGTVVLLELLPYGRLWGGVPLIDFFSLALGLAMVLAMDVWLRGGRWPLLVVGSVAASLVFVVKVTTVPVVGVLLMVSIVLVVADRGWRPSWRRALAVLALGPGLALVPLFVWTRYADEVKAASPATSELTSSALAEWNFGTWAQRTDPHLWQVLGQRVSQEIAGIGLVSLLLAVVLGAVFGRTRHRVVLAGLVAGVLAPVLIFFNLYVVHTYYLIAVYPLLCAVPVVGVAALASRFGGRVVIPAVVVAGLIALTTVALPLGRQDIAHWRDPGPITPVARQLREVTPYGAEVVLVGCDWSSEHLYQADRTGLMIRFQTPAQAWAENDIGDYGYLARCDATLDLETYLPTGYETAPTTAPDVYRIVRSGA